MTIGIRASMSTVAGGHFKPGPCSDCPINGITCPVIEQSVNVAIMSSPPIDLDHWRALATALFDDAALFPPGSAPMPDAVRGHRAITRTSYVDLVGPFVCPTSRVPEMCDSLGAGNDPVPVVLLADGGVLGVEQAYHLLTDDDRVQVVGLEVALPRNGDPGVFSKHVLEALNFSVPAAVEIPRVPGWQGALDVLAADGAERAKFRTGGPTPADIPSAEELAAQIAAAVERRVPFKLTAGLHHALREPGEGSRQHGFLNALAATALACGGAGEQDLADVLSATDAATVLAPLHECRPASVRGAFTSFGTCSLHEPIQDLVALGLLEDE